MSAADKEKIFVELRKYHQDAFSEQMVNEDMNRLRNELENIEDKLVNMILGLVNGKTEFVDMGEDLRNFKKKIKILPSGARQEDGDRKFFKSKVDQLDNILQIASQGTFKLKIPRYPKAVREERPGIVTSHN